MRIKAYAGYFDQENASHFHEVVRVDLGDRNDAGYVYDRYMHPVGLAVTLYTEYGESIVEDGIGNNLRALPVSWLLKAMMDDNLEDDYGARWTWEMDAVGAPSVNHVVLAVW